MKIVATPTPSINSIVTANESVVAQVRATNAETTELKARLMNPWQDEAKPRWEGKRSNVIKVRLGIARDMPMT